METILITGDDGYKSLGIRLLAQMFKDDYDIVIVASKEQRSGVGGGLKAYGSKAWGMEKVEGIDSYWVDGNPGDAMEFAQGFFPEGFDYVISGINWGENIGLSTLTASGTGGAGIRALALGISKKIVIMSWMQEVQDSTWSTDTTQKKVSDFIEYPGDSAKYIFEEVKRNNFFEKNLVNVNFPCNPTKEYKITKFIDSITKYYKYPVIIEEGTYRYDEQVLNYSKDTESDLSVDVGALLSGFISVTPFDIR